MNTAQLRKLAANAEKKQKWLLAALYRDLAIEYYPEKMGRLGQRDIARMKDIAESHREFAMDYLLEAAVTALKCLENITTDEFSKGGDKEARHALQTAIEATTGKPWD